MLAGLDAVDWSALTHAYGPATDVPDAIRALLVGDPAMREDALETLFCTIWHQGTVYPASAHAAPFLVELLADPGCREPAAILQLLACIAQGHSYVDVHFRGAEREAEGVPERLREELADVRAAHDAAADGIPVFLRRLRDPEAEVRRQAAALLGAFPARAADIVPALLDGSASEQDAEARAIAVESLARLAPRDPQVVDHCEGLLADEVPDAVRFAAAHLLALGLRDAAPEGAVAVLVDAFADPGRYPYRAAAAARALSTLGPVRGPDALIAALRRVAKPEDALEAALVLLERTFERALPVEGRASSSRGGRRRIEFWGMGRAEAPRVARVTELQRRVLQALCDCAALARIDTNVLDLYGLPADPAALAALVATSP